VEIKMILVSACLLGINCKYNGDNNKNEKVLNYLKDKEFVIICPEQLGGLSTPRFPSEITSNDGKCVIDGTSFLKNNQGIDVTENFLKGAYESLKIAQIYNIKEAILKEGSPSCGSNFIYDGTFKGVKKNGVGVTTALFMKNNIKVISEKEL
jgi:uncharacterized protein YbbK (DUF523 family)